MYREYRDRYGWSVVPLKEDGSKKPAVSWKQFQTRLPTDAEVEQWESSSGVLLSETQVAVITGAISGLVVLDVDSEAGWDWLKDYELPPTVQAWTTEPNPHMTHHPRGKAHFYFRHPGPEWVIPNRVKIKAMGGGIDVRGDGGYVVAPPSRHGPDKSRPSLTSGWDYSWEKGRGPHETEVYELPKWIWDRIGVHRATEKDPFATQAVEIFQEDLLPPEEPHWLRAALLGVSEGARDDTAARLAGYFLGARLPAEHVEAIMEAWNIRNTPPLHPREIAKVVRSVARKESTKQDVRVTAAIEQVLKPDDPKDTLAGINKVLQLNGGLRIVEIYKFLGDQPDVVLHFADGARMQLKPGQLMRQSAFQEQCVAQINYVPPDIATKKNPRAWKLVVQAILNAALQIEAAMEATRRGELTTALDAYLADNPPLKATADLAEAPDEPFILHDRLHLSSMLLHQYMATRLFSRWNIQDVARTLKELKWQQVRPRWGKGNPNRPWFWQAPYGYVPGVVSTPPEPQEAKVIPLRSTDGQI